MRNHEINLIIFQLCVHIFEKNNDFQIGFQNDSKSSYVVGRVFICYEHDKFGQPSRTRVRASDSEEFLSRVYYSNFNLRMSGFPDKQLLVNFNFAKNG